VESFNYLSVLLSIVLGLAMTQVLQGLRGQAAESSGFAGKFRCFLQRRVLKQFV
jgi:hypothetical protein